MMNFGVSVANRVSRHQPRPPSMSEYSLFGSGPSYWACIQVPNRPVWNRCPGYSFSSGQAATYIENPALYFSATFSWGTRR